MRESNRQLVIVGFRPFKEFFTMPDAVHAGQRNDLRRFSLHLIEHGAEPARHALADEVIFAEHQIDVTVHVRPVEKDQQLDCAVNINFVFRRKQLSDRLKFSLLILKGSAGFEPVAAGVMINGQENENQRQ